MIPTVWKESWPSESLLISTTAKVLGEELTAARRCWQILHYIHSTLQVNFSGACQEYGLVTSSCRGSVNIAFLSAFQPRPSKEKLLSP
jgi:hypothetical protein